MPIQKSIVLAFLFCYHLEMSFPPWERGLKLTHMANLYQHKVHGWQIRFRIHFPDGTNKVKTKFTRVKRKAVQLRDDALVLENITRTRHVGKEELIYFQHQRLLSKEEILAITGGKDVIALTWDEMRRCYEEYSRASHSAHNIKTVQGRLNNLEGYFKNILPSQITTHEIIKWQAIRRQEAATKTVIHERGILIQMLDMAVDRGAIPINPGRNRLLKNTLKIDKAKLPVALTYDEVSALMSAILKNPHLLGRQIYLATLLFLFGGLRRGEACFLTKEDIRDNMVIIQSKKVAPDATGDPDVLKKGWWEPKGNRPRNIELPQKIAKKVKSLLSNQDGGFIFGGKKTYCKDYFSKEFEKILKHINPNLSLHCLRHTFVTWRIEHGISGHGDNLVRVQMAAGHADIQTTMRYTHIKVSQEKNILDLIRK